MALVQTQRHLSHDYSRGYVDAVASSQRMLGGYAAAEQLLIADPKRGHGGYNHKGDQANRAMAGGYNNPTASNAPSGYVNDQRRSRGDVVEAYRNELYEEEMEKKIHGAEGILRLSMKPKNIPLLAQNELLLRTLERELQDNFQKSSQLSTTIIGTFVCFSRFQQFQHDCSDLIIKVLHHEIRCYETRLEDARNKQARLQQHGVETTGEDQKCLIQEEKGLRKKAWQQNKLFTLCLIGLRNLTENRNVEKKMIQKGLISSLVYLLDRQAEDLLVADLEFLKKLSVLDGARAQMCTQDAVCQFMLLAGHGNADVAMAALKLLSNLSCSQGYCTHFFGMDFLALLADHLKKPPFRGIALRLLYQISVNEESRAAIASFTDGILIILQLTIHFPQPRLGTDLVALLINLAAHPIAARALLDSGCLPQVMQRLLVTRDPLLCKAIRHLSSHSVIAQSMHEVFQKEGGRLGRWMGEFVYMAEGAINSSSQLLVDTLGTLAYMSFPGSPWAELCDLGLLNLLTQLLMPGFSDGDVVLEIVIILGNIALSTEGAQQIASTRLPYLLSDVYAEKRHDTDLVVQLMFTLEQFLRDAYLCYIVLEETEIISQVMEFASADGPVFIEQAMHVLQVVAECGPFCGLSEPRLCILDEVRQFRFKMHNASWCNGAEHLVPAVDMFSEDDDQSNEMEEYTDGSLLQEYCVQNGVEHLSERLWQVSTARVQ